jgi:RHH-type rel operon transcriptional repressor/antitoxin RelB
MFNGPAIDAMLGLRLEPELEDKLEALSARSGRSKSAIARDALRQYLDARDLAVEARRQSILASQHDDAADYLDFDDRGWSA